jgi:asparagine synthase (glutamine-hydrolysing)
MPGIVGLQTKLPRGWAELQLKRMVASMEHEDFYVSGTWIDEGLGVYVGWVLRKESSSTQMPLPLRNDRGDLVLILSGEDFSAPLQAKGKETRPQFERQPVFRMPASWGRDADFPACLNGRFQGLLVDYVRRVSTLFNDRYGLHRLYYHQATDAFYFAAEAKALLEVQPSLKRIEPRAMGEYITCGCALENRTIFEGIHILPGAAKWTVRNGWVDKKAFYFSPREWEEQEVLEPEEYYQQLRHVFASNLPRYFVSGQPIGLSLTGGLDTRMILAWHQPLPGSLPTYTFGGTYRDCRDVIVARRVAQACEQPHQVIRVGGEFLSKFGQYAERTVYLTDGCADVRRASDLYLNEQARQIAPVRMTGNYGSEVLRGLRAFKPVYPVAGLFQNELTPYFTQAEETYKSLLPGHPVSFAVFKQAPWHHYGLLALEETQLSLRSPYLDNMLVQTAFQAPPSMLTDNDACLRLIADGSPTLRSIPTDRDVGGAGPMGALARRVDQFFTKAEYAYDYGMPQWVAKIDHMVHPFHLERWFLGRHKFNHYRVWYRDALADYVREVLLDRRTLSRPFIQKATLETMVRGHLKGHANYTNEIHTLLTLELLHRLFIDEN